MGVIGSGLSAMAQLRRIQPTARGRFFYLVKAIVFGTAILIRLMRQRSGVSAGVQEVGADIYPIF